LSADAAWRGVIAVRVRRATDRPVLVAVIAVLVATGFVLARLDVAAHGDLAMFVVAGRLYVDARAAPPGLPVLRGSGYDGQFYYRMALDPLDLARTAFGIRFDSRSRLERIGYPALAWAGAGGRASLVPDSLVAVNILALGALGLGGGLLARDSGRHAMWGLVFPGYWGYLWTLGRDLTGISAAAFLVLGLYSYRRDRRLAAGVLLLGAVLCRETAVYPVAALGLVVMLGRDHRQGIRRVLDPAWILPAVGFSVWQLFVLARTGIVPILGSGSANLGFPLVGFVDGARHYLAALPSTASLLWCSELAILVAITAAAAWSVGRTSAPLYERIAWGGAVLVAILAASGIWLGDVGFRSLSTLYLFGWIVLLGTSRRLWPLADVSALMWAVVCVELVRFI